MTRGSRINLDRIGAMASTICAVHCLITGIALGLLSVLGLGFLGSETAEYTFLAVTVTIGVLAVWHGRKKHHSTLPAVFFVLGLGCWLVSHFVFGHGHGAGERSNLGGTAFAVLGGLLIVAFHVLNQRLAHRCGCSHCTTGK
ncbi:MerC domain-containing protein [bacterium]|nr:MAG: MerC domain-containing protein [bacterium]